MDSRAHAQVKIARRSPDGAESFRLEKVRTHSYSALFNCFEVCINCVMFYRDSDELENYLASQSVSTVNGKTQLNALHWLPASVISQQLAISLSLAFALHHSCITWHRMGRCSSSAFDLAHHCVHVARSTRVCLSYEACSHAGFCPLGWHAIY